MSLPNVTLEAPETAAPAEAPAESARVIPVAGRRRAAPQPYDFRRPNKFSRDHIRALQIVYETFSRQFSTVLSTSLRAVSHVTPGPVEQLTYDEYVRRSPNPSYLAILSMEPLPGGAILNIPLDLAMATIDRLLGGNGSGLHPYRALTDIENGLMRNITERILRELTYAFESVVPLEAKIVATESNPQFAQIAAPSDMTITTAFDMRIGDEVGKASLCIPFASLAPFLDSIDGAGLFGKKSAADAEVAARLLTERVNEVPLNVRVQFDQVLMSSAEIVDLKPGDVLPLGHATSKPLTVTVDGVPCYAAAPGRKGKRLACLIVPLESDGQPQQA